MIYFVGDKNHDTKYTIVSIEKALSYFKDKQYIQLDTETEGFDPYTKRVICWQIGDTQNQFVIDNSVYPIEDYKEFFEDKTKIFLLQNAKFDLRFFMHANVWIHKVYDTYLAEVILTNSYRWAPKALDALVLKYTGIDTVDKTIRGQIHYRGLDDIVIKYAAEDVEHLEKIMWSQLHEAKRLGLRKAIDLDNEFVKPLAYCEYCGIKLNEAEWMERYKVNLHEKEKARKELDQYILDNDLKPFMNQQFDLFRPQWCEINWSSGQQVADVMEYLGVNVWIYDREKRGMKRSVEKSVIQPQQNKFDIIPIYLRYTKYSKQCSTYGPNVIAQINPVTGRIHTQFKQLVATGRLASGGKDKKQGMDWINLQNIPSDEDTRACFIAEPGNYLTSTDYSGQEQIIMANFSLDENLLKFYREGLGDMHSFVAQQMYPELKNLSLVDIKKYHPEKRQAAKSAGFAINYGGDGTTIAHNLGLLKEEGVAIYNAYFAAFPKLQDYFNKVFRKAMRDGYITYNGLTGRKYFFDKEKLLKQSRQFTPEFWDLYRIEKEKDSQFYQEKLQPKVSDYYRALGAIKKKSLNYPIQGSGADATKIAGIFLYNYIIENNLQGIFKIVNFIHDEILTEQPIEKTEEYNAIIQDFMEKAGLYLCKTILLKATPDSGSYWKH